MAIFKKKKDKKPKEKPLFKDNAVDVKHKDYARKEGETQAEYNERVPVAYQQPEGNNDFDYLGRVRP